MYNITYLLMSLGMLLIFAGTLLIFIDVVRRTSSGEYGKAERRVDAGGAVIIGPIPIVFGSNKYVTKSMLVLALVLTALAMLLTIMNYYLRVT